MRLFDKEIYIARRQRLKALMGGGRLLFLGNEQSSINFRDNWYHFRQDSTFLYFFGLDVPGLAALIDVDDDSEIIFGDDITVEESVWTGPVPAISELASKVGIEKTQPISSLQKLISGKTDKGVHYLPPYRLENADRIATLLGRDLHTIANSASVEFIKAVVSLRNIKSEEEIIEISNAVDITADMHLAAMQEARPGMKEYNLVGVVHGRAISGGGQLSFPVILTVNGQTLHNHYHGNTIREGQMVLCDAGAENDMYYAGDLTRTFPVGRTFSGAQRDVYQIVLNAYQTAAAALKPGVRFLDIHLLACKKLVEGLKAIGLMKGDVDAAVQQGAHALFFPCGLGHMMGLDVHDMEDLGEQYVGYTDELTKSKQFGLKSLRLGKELQEGFVLTVEPGIYMIPELMDQWRAENMHSDFIQYGNLDRYREFGGIRIEDNFLITRNGSRKLGKELPTTPDEIEAVRGR